MVSRVEVRKPLIELAAKLGVPRDSDAIDGLRPDGDDICASGGGSSGSSAGCETVGLRVIEHGAGTYVSGTARRSSSGVTSERMQRFRPSFVDLMPRRRRWWSRRILWAR